MIKNFLCCLMLLILTLPNFAFPGEVQEVCNPTGVKVLELDYRKQNENFNRIKTTNLGEHRIAKYLKQYYFSDLPFQGGAIAYVNRGNELYFKVPKLRKNF